MSTNTQTPSRALLRRIALLLLCAAVFSTAPVALAQTSNNASDQTERVALHQALLDLTNPWTVMCVAAHPDDEDGATLTVLRRKYGAHTVTVFSTYGEGGQNAIGPELYEELGAIRARETLAAAEIQGSEPSFLALRDFGFSKSADEAFRVWGHDEALRRMVSAIRALRPDVIITNHDTTSGHGHHQATGRLVLEAFDAAADPARFPEQLRDAGVRVWQVQRLFVRVNYENGTGSKAEEEAAARAGRIVAINPNERDAVRGTTYAEQALQALHQHASQGPWPATVPKDGAPVIRYRLAREAKVVEPLPQQPQTFLDGLRLSAKLSKSISLPISNGQALVNFAGQPELVSEALLRTRTEGWLETLQSSGDVPRANLLTQRFNRALAAANGLAITFTPDVPALIPGTPTTFTVSFDNQGHKEISLLNASLRNVKTGQVSTIISDDIVRLKPEHIFRVRSEYMTLKGAQVNVPGAEHLYDQLLFGETFAVLLEYKIADGATVSLSETKQVDVAPAIEIKSVTPSPLIITPATVGKIPVYAVTLTNHLDAPFTGELIAGGPTFSEAKPESGLLGKRGDKARQRFSLAANETRAVQLNLAGNFNITDFARSGKHPVPNVVTLAVIGANTIPVISKKRIHVAYSDARAVPKLRVGYIRSYDDTLRNALTALGVEAKELTIADVQAGELKNFDTIIVDNRGYQAHPELVAANALLLEYAHNGGTLIVFYHKTGEWNPDEKKQRPQLAPYPITLGNLRVTDETAPVTFTEPQSALLNFPNKIEAKDFDGWIQERGLYYPKEWDAHYSAPFAMSDAGEAPLRGGLLAADYGRGHYIYTSMVWYRQLRAGVPGAYRVFANMISYGHAGAKGQSRALR